MSPPQSWAEVWALTPHVVYSWVQQTPLAWQPEDTPSGALRVELTIHNVADNVVSGSKSATLAYIDGEATLIRYVGEEMDTDASNGHWAKLATATPPQEFDLPLAEGWLPIDARYGAVYWKTQESIVNISLGLKSDHTVTNGETIAILPSGFRPKKTLKIPITAVNQNELLVHGYVDINRSDGSIQIYKITDQIKELCFPTTNFLANG